MKHTLPETLQSQLPSHQDEKGKALYAAVEGAYDSLMDTHRDIAADIGHALRVTRENPPALTAARGQLRTALHQLLTHNVTMPADPVLEIDRPSERMFLRHGSKEAATAHHQARVDIERRINAIMGPIDRSIGYTEKSSARAV